MTKDTLPQGLELVAPRWSSRHYPPELGPESAELAEPKPGRLGAGRTPPNGLDLQQLSGSTCARMAAVLSGLEPELDTTPSALIQDVAHGPAGAQGSGGRQRLGCLRVVASFQVSIDGRFSVSTEDPGSHSGSGLLVA